LKPGIKKSDFVRDMFSSIAPRYDFLNRLLSAGRDRYWRREAVKELPLEREGTFLDVATGTGDVAIQIVKQGQYPGTRVTGVDFSEKMLTLGRKKVQTRGLQDQIDLRQGDAMNLPFEDDLFQGAIVAFGLRNFTSLENGLKEMLRVVQPGGKVVILEFSRPENPLLRRIYYAYFCHALPFIGSVVSGSNQAYQYLPDSVMRFPSACDLKKSMENCAMVKVRSQLLTFGIVALYVGEKEGVS